MIVKLRNIAQVKGGNSAPKKDSFGNSGIPFVRAGSLEFLVRNESIDECEKIGEIEAKNSKLKLFPKGSILFAKSGMSAKMGRVYQLPKDAFVVSHLAVIIPEETKVSSSFLKYYFIGKPPFYLIRDEAYPSIKLTDIEGIEIDLPNIETQNKIVAILDKGSALVQKRQKTIQLLDDLLRAEFLNLFQRDFGNKNTQILLEDLIIEGPQNGLYKHDSFYGEGIPILRIDSFYDGLVIGIEDLKRVKLEEDEIEKYSLSKDDIVINRVNSREYLGKSAIIPELNEPTVFESNMMRFKVNEELIKPQFLIFLMQLDFIKSQILQKAKDAINQSSINQKDVKSLLIPNCSMKEQLNFLLLYEKATDSKRKALMSLKSIELLFKSLLQNAFSGKLKLNISIELDALLKEIDLQKSENDLFSIITNEEYLLSLVSRLNNQDFESQDLYDKAKHATFQMLKAEERLAQEYDEQTKSLKLVVK